MEFEYLLLCFSVGYSLKKAHDAFRAAWAGKAAAILPLLPGATASVLCFAMVFSRLGVVEAGAVTHDRATSYYLSLITFATIGYGDVVPTKEARFFAGAEALLGYVYLGLVATVAINAILPQSARSGEELPTNNKRSDEPDRQGPKEQGHGEQESGNDDREG